MRRSHSRCSSKNHQNQINNLLLNKVPCSTKQSWNVWNFSECIGKILQCSRRRNACRNVITWLPLQVFQSIACTHHRIMKTSTTHVIWVSLENILSLVVCSQLCTVLNHGRCVCLQASVPQRKLTPVSNICSHRDKLAFQLLSICLLSMAMTLITH